MDGKRSRGRATLGGAAYTRDGAAYGMFSGETSSLPHHCAMVLQAKDSEGVTPARDARVSVEWQIGPSLRSYCFPFFG